MNWTEWDRKGIIPGPGETEEAFCERIDATRAAFERQESPIPPHRWEWAKERLFSLFGFSPAFCSASYGSAGLAPWEAAATWIDVKRVYTIRLKKSRWVSWLIDLREVLAHEAAHAARAAFDEPRFEEVFAYLTSRSRWRAALGPLLRRTSEGIALIGLAVSGVWLGAVGYLAFSLFFAVLAIRLVRARIVLERAAKRAIPLLRNPAEARAFLFRLTDGEIERLAAGKPLLPRKELRWHLLKESYLIEDYDGKMDFC